MYTKRFIFIIALALITLQGKNASAFFMPRSLPLSKEITEADVIIEARITNYIPNPVYQENPKSGSGGIKAIVTLTRIKPRGQYDVSVVRTIKGQSESKLQLKMPYVLASYYDNSRFKIHPGAVVLIFLKNDATGHLSPIDPTVPFIPLSEGLHTESVSKAGRNIESQVIGLMLASLSESAMRHANLFLLRNSVDDRIPKAVSPYLNDPDLRIQDIALYCMLTNQQIKVIPQVAKLERLLFPEEETIGSSAKSLEALENLKTPTAVPYLNPLLFEPCKYSRINTMFTLRELANRTSIPYLILALRDPRASVAFMAYQKLHQLIGRLGAVRDSDYFEIQRDSASSSLYVWWKDELSGKHPKSSNSKGQPQISQKEISVLPLDKLNPLLLNPDTANRQEAINALGKRADDSSIPYLILALIDPNTTISYDAYVTLYRLIPALGTPQSRKEFEANTETATHPIYIWWEDELNGNHISIPNVR